MTCWTCSFVSMFKNWR